MSASIAVITSDSSVVPDRLEAKLRLLTLTGSANPLVEGGTLARTLSGGTVLSTIPSGATSFTNTSVLATSLPSSVGFVLQAPVGSPLFDLRLEVVDYGGSSSSDRVEIQVTHIGVSKEVASGLSFDPEMYTWRLSGVASVTDRTLELAFELVQEQEPTEFVDALASTRLAFADDGSGTQTSVIKVKRSGVLAEPAP
jgi:hypothetical protein